MSGQSGSVFIEALIAAAIVSMILAAGFQVTADSANRRRMVEARRYALMVARSQMAAVGYSIPLTAGAAECRDGPARWRGAKEPCARAAGDTARRALYCVAVSMRDARGGPPLVTLKSRRLAPPV